MSPHATIDPVTHIDQVTGLDDSLASVVHAYLKRLLDIDTLVVIGSQLVE
jgi:hypothetical protein